MAGHVRAPEAPREHRPVDRVLTPLQRFMRYEASGGLLLLGVTLVALVWANSPWASSYAAVWGAKLSVVLDGNVLLGKPLVVWINDALMAVFFFVVGLEIKRELAVGELSSVRKASIPLIAAIGGMAVPALIFALVNVSSPGTSRGWGIPMATDIAFALGMLALVGTRAPLGLKVFLTSLAIVDDLGALLVIAIFYTEQLGVAYLGFGAIALAAMVGMNLLRVRSPIPYALVGLVLWYCLLKSGVHPTIAGVLGAMAIPARPALGSAPFASFMRERADKFEEAESESRSRLGNPKQEAEAHAMERATAMARTPLQRLEGGLLPWVTFGIIPVFALANAWVSLFGGASVDVGHGAALAHGVGEAVAGAQGVVGNGAGDAAGGAGASGGVSLTSPLMLGIVLGLVVGKPLGIVGFTWAALKLKVGELPSGVTMRHLWGTGALAGIGFTMALFIGGLAFGADPTLLNEAKLAVLIGSAVSAVIGLGILFTCPKQEGEAH